MYTDPKIAEARSANPSNLIIKHRNSAKTTHARTEDEKVFLGTMAELSGGYAVKKAFGASHSHSYEYSKGIANHRLGVDSSLKTKVEAATQTAKEKISDKALDVLTNALGLIDERVAKNQVGKTTDISSVAKDMAIIHEKMSPRDLGMNLGLGIQVIINAPAQKRVNEYEIVEG